MGQNYDLLHMCVDLTFLCIPHSAKARLGRGRGQREAQQRERVEVLAAKDRDRQAQFMASLGVDLSKGKRIWAGQRCMSILAVYVYSIV